MLTAWDVILSLIIGFSITGGLVIFAYRLDLWNNKNSKPEQKINQLNKSRTVEKHDH